MYEQAVRRNPEDSSAQWWYGTYLDGVGRPDAAVARLQRGAKAEPGCAALLTDLAVVFANCGEYAQAIRRCEEALEIEPASAVAHFVMAEVLLACGQVGHTLRFSFTFKANFEMGDLSEWSMTGTRSQNATPRNVQVVTPASSRPTKTISSMPIYYIRHAC
jgi:tetratricopeptide (TPR) repeat protein